MIGVLATIALVVALVLPPAAGAASRSGPGTHPWLVVLCNFSNSPPPSEGYDRDYYRDLFTPSGSGQLNVFDYWRDVSYGQLSIRGTEVTEWVVARDRRGTPLSRDRWRSFSRDGKARACANGTTGVDFSKYWGFVAIFPEAIGTLAKPIDAKATTLELASDAYFPDTFPDPPFLMDINPGKRACERRVRPRCWEQVRVTAVSGNTLTIKRGLGGTRAGGHAENDAVNAGGDLFGSQGQLSGLLIKGKRRTLAYAVLAHQAGVSAIAHEMGHGLGFRHSLALSKAPDSYNNCPDLMSFASCVYTFNDAGTAFGTSVVGEPPGSKGPGLVAPNLEVNGLIPASERLLYRPATGQRTLKLKALGDPNALGRPGHLVIRVPARVSIPTDRRRRTRTDYYSIEYREKAGWDRGFSDDSVNLQLHGRNGRSYWVDRTPLVDEAHAGRLFPGDTFVDPRNDVYLAVNAKDTDLHTATVTVAPARIASSTAWWAPTSGRSGETTRLAAKLSVKGTFAPVPAVPVALQLGDAAGCLALTNFAGVAECEVELPAPGSYEARARFLGDRVYRPGGVTRAYSVSP